jgi:hypothetical protein
MHFYTKFSAVVLIILSLVALTFSDLFKMQTGLETRNTKPSITFVENLSVKNSQSFPELFKLGDSRSKSDAFIWAVHNKENIRFVFKTEHYDTDEIGDELWQKNSIELYLADKNDINIFYQIIVSFNDNIQFLKYQGGKWSDKLPTGERLISREPQFKLAWSPSEKIKINREDGNIEILIPFSEINIKAEDLIVQVIHNIDGGKNRFVLSLNKDTNAEQDRRGWSTVY